MADKNKNENSVGNGIGPADEPRADIDNLLAEAAGSLDEIDSQLGRIESDSAAESPQPSGLDIAPQADSKKSDKNSSLKTQVQQIDNTLANLEKELKNLTRQVEDTDDTADNTAKQSIAGDDALTTTVNDQDSDAQNTSVAQSQENQSASDDNVDDVLAQLEQEMAQEENATDDTTSVANDSTDDDSGSGDNISKVIAELPGIDINADKRSSDEPSAGRQDDSIKQEPISRGDDDEVQDQDQDDKVVMDELDLSISPPRNKTSLGEQQTEGTAQNDDPYAHFNGPQKALIRAVNLANKPFAFISDSHAKDALGLVGIITIIVSMIITALILLLK